MWKVLFWEDVGLDSDAIEISKSMPVTQTWIHDQISWDSGDQNELMN